MPTFQVIYLPSKLLHHSDGLFNSGTDMMPHGWMDRWMDLDEFINSLDVCFCKYWCHFVCMCWIVCVCVLMCVYIHQTISSQQRHETKNKTKLEEGLVYLTVEDLYIYIYINSCINVDIIISIIMWWEGGESVCISFSVQLSIHLSIHPSQALSHWQQQQHPRQLKITPQFIFYLKKNTHTYLSTRGESNW